MFRSMFFLEPGVVSGDKRNLSGQKFVGNTPQSILIAFLIHPAKKLFRRHIWKATAIVIMFCIEGILQGHNTKISQEHISRITKENILGFEISVENIHLMRILQNLSYHTKDSERFLNGE